MSGYYRKQSIVIDLLLFIKTRVDNYENTNDLGHFSCTPKNLFHYNQNIFKEVKYYLRTNLERDK